MDNLFVIVGLISLLGILVGFVMLFIRKYRSTGWKVLLACCVAFGVSGYAHDGAANRDAQSAGYVDAGDQELATELGYTSAREWAVDRERILEETAQQREAEARADAEAYQRRQAQAEHERLEAEAAERARLEAEWLAEETAALSAEDQRRAEMASKTSFMTDSIVATIQLYYGVEAQALIPGSPFCRDDGYCFLTAGPFDVEVYGAGLAVVKTTNQASRTDYVEMCSVVFAAISGSDIMFAGQVVGEIYGAAIRDGSFERDVSNIEINISPSSEGILGCRFFKY